MRPDKAAFELPADFFPRLRQDGHEAGVLVSVIVPVKDEQEAIAPFVMRVGAVLDRVCAGSDWEILFIDDGSSDATYARIAEAGAAEPRIRALSLSRNFGKEAALTAGLDHACGRVVVPLDVDLQDPPEVLDEMLARWREGFEVVYGVRRERKSDTVVKRATAGLFYRLHNRLTRDKIPEHAGDFRLLDRKVVDAINRMPERNRFMKGLFAWSGFRHTSVEYERAQRSTGTSKFGYWKLWTLAIDGITSSSTMPLRIWSYIGGSVALAAIGYALFITGRTLIYGSPVSGYPSIIVSVMFFSGMQMLSLGVLGEYVGRILIETKQRPIYVVRDQFGLQE
jgi:glycosyltransferase involved in cell wall biosynthesis